ncbi:MAG: TetR/AcrR family transcriptional regulator [Oscillospiraceae bacterium]|nr:TetR/AcrR family transcriptional regulator [Oscillospiraceae bacterium]
MTKGERTKKKLLEIAYELFLTKGYEETSVDDILSIAHIAKGTYYYYFQSKEQMLEEVVGMMIDDQRERASVIASSDIPAPEKIVGIISCFRPQEREEAIGELLERPENLLMHHKMQERLFESIEPLLCGIVGEGRDNGLFDCDNVSVRVKILLIVSSALFDGSKQTEDETDVFIDLAEKLLGADKGSMDFIRQLVK